MSISKLIMHQQTERKDKRTEAVFLSVSEQEGKQSVNVYTWKKKKVQKYASLRQTPQEVSACTKNFFSSSPRKAESI